MHRAPAAACLAARRAELADLDLSITTACEWAAGKGRRRRAGSCDFARWTPTIWHRYLREARTQNHLLGPRMRFLATEIGRLEARVGTGRPS